MRFVIFVLDDGQAQDAGRTDSATEAERTAIDVFNDRLQADGQWVLAAGIGSPDTATVIDDRGAAASFLDGSFSDASSYIAGFWIVDVPDFPVARRLAAAGSRACNRRVELRPFL